MLKAIFLDFGNTIVDESRFIPAARMGIVRFVRSRVRGLADERTLDERLCRTPGLEASHPLMQDVRGRAFEERLCKFKRFAQACGCALDEAGCKEMMRVYDLAAAESDSLIDQTREALRLLAARYALAVISNGYSGFVHTTLKLRSLDHYFRTVIVSQDVNIEKPDRRIFELAATRLRIPLQEAMMVGDSFPCDVVAARECGMANCWINPANAPPPINGQCDLHVPRLIDLANRLCFR
jgi:HAD superfamily hydrolase (TIGR01549 family)